MRKKEKTLYAGSASTTTALCIEALHKYEQLKRSPLEKKVEGGVRARERQREVQKKRIHRHIMKKVSERFSACPLEVRKRADIVVQDIVTNDTQHIVLLPFLFRESLGSVGKHISDELVVHVGAANVFGWIAYTLYDHFLDGEGDVQTLPLAHMCLRESAVLFGSCVKGSAFENFSKTIFDRIDSANIWEVAHCRSLKVLPQYKKYAMLADKSLGHALSPLALLYALGHDEYSNDVRSTLDFFSHYIIARQLDDDAHDWEEDLAHGCVNAALSGTLKGLPLKDRRNVEKIRFLFWDKTILSVCRDIFYHTKRARASLKRIKSLERKDVFIEMIERIERSAQKALKERDEARTFIRMYGKKTKKVKKK